MRLSDISVVLFDMDGTLLDTKEYIFRAFEYTLERHGVQGVSRADLEALQGQSLEECYQLLAPGYEFLPLQASHREFQHDNMDLVKPFPNTLETLRALRRAGMRLGVVSTRAKTAYDSLHQSGIFDLLDAVVTGDDAVAFKPHPEGILKALAAIGAGAEEAMMVGDTHADVMAGRNAETVAVGVTYGFTPRPAMLELAPDYVIDDIREVRSLLGT